MPQQSLTVTVEPCRDLFNDFTASKKSFAVIRISSSGLNELKFCSKELALVSLVVPKVSPVVLTLRGPLRSSSGHFWIADAHDSHLIGQGSFNPFTFANSSSQLHTYNRPVRFTPSYCDVGRKHNGFYEELLGFGEFRSYVNITLNRRL